MMTYEQSPTLDSILESWHIHPACGSAPGSSCKLPGRSRVVNIDGFVKSSQARRANLEE